MSDNYYIILDLDPSIDDVATIENRIKERLNLWNRQKNSGAGSDKRKAEKWQKLVPDMREKLLKDPAQRRAIAAAAAKELKEADKKRLVELDALIDRIADKAIGPEALKSLRQSTKDQVSEKEIVDRLLARGISVTGPTTTARPKRPKLEASKAARIQGLLRHVGSASLYEFLGTNSRSSLQALSDAARAVSNAYSRKTDPDSTNRNELAGECMAAFKTAETKEQYDNTLATQVLSGSFEFRIEIEAQQGGGFIDEARLRRLVGEAVQLGAVREVAAEFIQDAADARNWKVQRVASSADSLPLCGFCNTIASSATDARCVNCGRPFVEPCPQCGTPVPTQNQACATCGCTTGDAPYVAGLMADAERALLDADFAAGLSSVAQALACWTGWRPAVELRARIERARDERVSRVAAVEAIIRDGKLEEARTAYHRMIAERTSPRLEHIDRRIEEGIQKAREMTAAGDALRTAGKMDEAIVKYEAALSYCADWGPARSALAQCPPAAPSGLKASTMSEAIRLTWDAASAKGAVGYRVLRKARGAPSSATDGDRLAEVTGRQFDDVAVPAGVPLFYAVYAVRGGVASAAACVSGPHLRVAEVDALSVEAGDKQVALSWKRPAGCVSVEVWRSQAGATPSGSTQQIAASGDAVVDTGVSNGVRYAYLIVACFTDPANPRGVLRSPGRTVTTTPVTPPQQVTDLRARREGQSVMLTWTAPPAGAVRIHQSPQPIAAQPGRMLQVSELSGLGALVRSTGPTSAQTTLGEQGRVYFVPVTVVADTGVVGVPTAITLLNEVTALTSQRDTDAIRLVWTWPAGAAEVLVTWSAKGFLPSAEARGDGASVVTRAEFERRGFWELRGVPRAPHYFTVFVRDPIAKVHSGGARVLEAAGVECEVRYKLDVRRSLVRRAITEAHVNLRCSDLAALPPVNVVVKSSALPLRPDDGRIVVSTEELAFSQGAVRIELPGDVRTGYVKLFFKDAANASAIRLLPGSLNELRLG